MTEIEAFARYQKQAGLKSTISLNHISLHTFQSYPGKKDTWQCTCNDRIIPWHLWQKKCRKTGTIFANRTITCNN